MILVLLAFPFYICYLSIVLDYCNNKANDSLTTVQKYIKTDPDCSSTVKLHMRNIVADPNCSCSASSIKDPLIVPG